MPLLKVQTLKACNSERTRHTLHNLSYLTLLASQFVSLHVNLHSWIIHWFSQIWDSWIHSWMVWWLDHTQIASGIQGKYRTYAVPLRFMVYLTWWGLCPCSPFTKWPHHGSFGHCCSRVGYRFKSCCNTSLNFRAK